MSNPYLLVSDLHFHDWTQFSTLTGDGHIYGAGVNSRVADVLHEWDAAITNLRSEGGHEVFVAGDVFHVRGKLKPTVINPIIQFIQEHVDQGIEFHMIPGNHDLESDETTSLGNALGSLRREGVRIYEEPTIVHTASGQNVLMIPWIKSKEVLKSVMANYCSEFAGLDIIIHTPINGVLKNIPDTGLDPVGLAGSLDGSPRIFSGHFHHHKQFAGGVMSIGALTHQTFGDVESVEGYLLVYPDKEIHHRSTVAPKFVDVIPGMPVPNLKGNNARVKLGSATEAEILEWREAIEAGEPNSVTIIAMPKVEVTRTGSVIEEGHSVVQSIGKYIEEEGMEDGVFEEARVILDEVEGEAA